MTITSVSIMKIDKLNIPLEDVKHFRYGIIVYISLHLLQLFIYFYMGMSNNNSNMWL